MSGERLQRRLELAATDTVAHLALGLASAARRLDGILDRHVVPGGSVAGDAQREDDAVHLILGLVALRQRLRSAWDRAARSEGAHAAPPSIHRPSVGDVPWR